jgi:rhamnosyltransferase
MPSVAILLAAYNGREWLPEQLVSIVNQADVNLHIFVSIDKSTDGTEAWLAGYAETESRLTLLPNGERFGSAARNFYRLLRDVDVSSFDYVAFADQDDIWLPDKLLRATNELEKGYMGYSSNVLAFWPDGREHLIKKAQPQRNWDFLFESPGPGCSFVLQRELVLAIQQTLPSCWPLLQEINYHDWFVYAFARARKLPWFIDSYAGLRYRQHTHNELGANTGLSAFLMRMVRVAGGSGFRQAATLAKVIGLANDPFVSAWADGQRFGFCRLALKANQSRRRKRDRFFFFILCVKRCLFGDSSSQ